MSRLPYHVLAVATLGLGLGFAAPASAQDAPVPPAQEAPSDSLASSPASSDVIVGRGDSEQAPVIDQVDRVAAQPTEGQRIPFARAGGDGVRAVRPGALLFASFDSNFDGRITRPEFDAGAAGSFKAADANGDGTIAGFEQNDWAAAVGTANDVLSNPMAFDSDLDRNVTQAEFVAGLRRIADALADPATGDIMFSQLVQPLRQPEQSADRGVFGPPPGNPGGRPPRPAGPFGALTR